MKIIEFNNIQFYVGQSAKENWELLDKAKKINQNFIWFHLNSFPSPYVIMHASCTDISNTALKTDILLYGANLCKDYSKYKFFKDLKILYMPIKNISKSNTIGEVIIKGKGKIIKL